MYAALAVANLSTSSATHSQLLEEEVLRPGLGVDESLHVVETFSFLISDVTIAHITMVVAVNVVASLSSLSSSSSS